MTPLQFVGRLGEVDVEATVSGGGGTGQSGAIRLALSRALASFVDADRREKMRIGKLLIWGQASVIFFLAFLLSA